LEVKTKEEGVKFPFFRPGTRIRESTDRFDIEITTTRNMHLIIARQQRNNNKKYLNK
jgi:hypothetical protein